MQEDETILPFSLYSEYLETISNIKFSFREIDILACALNGKSVKGIGHFLSISPHTVETHIRNILRKIDCGSRDGIIQFVENSDKFLLLKKYYSSLLLYLAFEQSLKHISKLISGNPSCLLVYWQNFPLMPQFSNHLKQVGFTISLKHRQDPFNLFTMLKDHNVDYVFYCLSKEEHFSFNQEPIQVPENTLFLQFDNVQSESIQFKFPVYSIDETCYYFSFFNAIQKIFSDLDFSSIFEDFKKKYKNVQEDLNLRPSPTQKIEEDKSLNSVQFSFFLTRKLAVTLILFTLAMGGIGGFLFLNYFSKDGIRVDLNLPNHSVFLPRSELVIQIDNAFKGKEGIKTIALIGTGGAGKTTLARHYIHQQKTNIIWEINAETSQSLKTSFENFAYALARTEEDRRNLERLQEIKDSNQREMKILQFVKDHLKLSQDWLLLYDNIETMADIASYFPSDFKTWGQGKVILTTRDNTIKNHKNITHVIQIGELADKEKLDLFSKIMASDENISHSLKENIKIFLKEIPSFPLDVTTAAFYLKTTNLSLASYLQRLNQNYKDFDDAQQALLKEAGDYHKTRHSIITLSLQQIIAAHPDFQDLLLLISLIDSQNISRDLIESNKYAPTVDNFIYYLKKYSLITEQTPNLNSISMFSIHRSTQKIILDYFVNKIGEEKRNSLIKLIANNLEDYASSIIEEEDLLKMKRLENHYSAFLNHTGLLTEDLSSIIMSELGYIKHYLGNYTESKLLLEKAFVIFSNRYNTEHIKYVKVLTYLGMCDRHLGNYEIARDLLEKCVVIYKNNSFKEYKNFADALLYLGMTYRHLGNYKRAKELMEEGLSVYEKYCKKNYAGIARALGYVGYIYRYLGDYKKAKDLIERSYLIYKKHLSNEHINVARTLLYLGTIQMDLCNYGEAKKLLEQSFSIYKDHSPSEDLAWPLGFLGNIYRGLGEYDKAERALVQCLSIYQKELPENHIDIAWVQAYLADLYKTLGEYEKAKNFAENSYVIYEKNLGGKNVIISWILTYLGEIYQKLGKNEQSKAVLERSLSIHKAHFDHFHPRVGWAMLRLGQAYLNCGDYKKAVNSFEQALTIYKKIYKDDNIEIAHVYSGLGQFYLLKNHFDLAHDFFQKALTILQKQGSPEAYVILENFADLHLKKSLDLRNRGASQHPHAFKNQAISSLKQALKIVKTHFPVDSPHRARIEIKLKNIEQS